MYGFEGPQRNACHENAPRNENGVKLDCKARIAI